MAENALQRYLQKQIANDSKTEVAWSKQYYLTGSGRNFYIDGG